MEPRLCCIADPRVRKTIATARWWIENSEGSERAETSNPATPAIREAWGHAYRLSDRNWKKLHNGTFYNPAHHITEIDPAKVMMFHAKDDPYIPYRSVVRFAEKTGIKLNLLQRGGHISTDGTVRKYWPKIRKFFEG